MSLLVFSAFSQLGSFTTPLKLPVTIWPTTRIHLSNMYTTDFSQYTKAIPFLLSLSLSHFYFFSYTLHIFYHLFSLSSLFSFLFSFFSCFFFLFPFLFLFSLLSLVFIFSTYFVLPCLYFFSALDVKSFPSASTRTVSSSSWEYTLQLISLTLNSLFQSENEINFLNFLQLLPERPKSKSLWSRFYTQATTRYKDTICLYPNDLWRSFTSPLGRLLSVSVMGDWETAVVHIGFTGKIECPYFAKEFNFSAMLQHMHF